MKKLLAACAVLALIAALPAFAGSTKSKKPITEKAGVTVKATIEAIDHSTRLITFKDDEGNYEEVYAGPEIKRFNELKVGDKVTFKYTESVVFQLRKPGEPVAEPGAKGPVLTSNATKKPSGTITHQETTVVTIKALDEKKGSVTVTTEDGRTMSFKVQDKGNLKGVAPGDRVEITYAAGLAVSVE
jgi:Cu/Ag efflux protein CusF